MLYWLLLRDWGVKRPVSSVNSWLTGIVMMSVRTSKSVGRGTITAALDFVIVAWSVCAAVVGPYGL